MRLSKLTQGFECRIGTDPEIRALTEDSRRVAPGTLFVAVRGTVEDGQDYVADALGRGAVAVASDREIANPRFPFVHLPDARAGLATLASRFFGNPARELRLIGFTGTFGKTSTSAILRDLLAAGGQRPGVLGSLGARYGDFHDPGTGLTTPAPVEMHRALRGLSAAGADTVIMEVTSHALRLGRAAGLVFGGGLLAAIKPGEHTDFHRSYEDYVGAKRLFLDHLSKRSVFAYDADNHAARTLAHEARVRVRTGFSLDAFPAREPRANVVAMSNVVVDGSGSRFTVGGVRMHSPLLGRGHLRNVALALTYAHADGVSLDIARRVLRTLAPLPRRMERYATDGRLVLDDTAGHPDSLQAAFEVAAMLRRAEDPARTAVVYAVRGNRGLDINRRNARVLADLAAEHGVTTVIVTASLDVAGPHDQAAPDEIDAARDAFTSRGQRFEFHETLAGAVDTARRVTSPGDLIVLLGAQGMNEGRRLLSSAGSESRI